MMGGLNAQGNFLPSILRESKFEIIVHYVS